MVSKYFVQLVIICLIKKTLLIQNTSPITQNQTKFPILSYKFIYIIKDLITLFNPSLPGLYSVVILIIVVSVAVIVVVVVIGFYAGNLSYNDLGEEIMKVTIT